MPIIKSAKKRVKIAEKAYARNTKVKRELREALKAFARALESGKPTEIAKAESKAVSVLDTAAKKAIIHPNKAARKKSQLAAAAKAKGIKKTAVRAKAAPKKPAGKKPAGKTQAKSPAKKATSKK